MLSAMDVMVARVPFVK